MKRLLTGIALSVCFNACLPRPKRPVFAKVDPFSQNALPEVEPEIEPEQDPEPSSGPILSRPDPVAVTPSPNPVIGAPQPGPGPSPLPLPVPTPEPTPGMTAMPVPMTNAVFYRPLGKGAGGYQKIKDAKFPDTCVKGDIVPTSGALFPFTETQHLILRGPLLLSDLVVFEKKANATYWTRIADLSSLIWEESNYGSSINLGKYPLVDKVLENGREIFTALPNSGEKIVVVRVKMPRATTAVYKTELQNDVPAVWMLNSRIFQAPSGQYFCNCRGLGNPGGCGELDIAEIIPENKDEVTTTIYSYEGARGGKLSARPTTQFQIYAAVLRNDNGTGEVAVLEASSFDFSKTDLSESFVAKDWLPAAKRLNAGSEALIPPPKLK